MKTKFEEWLESKGYVIKDATFEEDAVYDQKLAEGFIQLNALRLKINTLMRKKR